MLKVEIVDAGGRKVLDSAIYARPIVMGMKG